MRKVACLVVVVLAALFPRAALGQEVPRFRQFDVAAIDQLFERSNQAFSSKDYTKLRDYLQSPFIAGNACPAP